MCASSIKTLTRYRYFPRLAYYSFYIVSSTPQISPELLLTYIHYVFHCVHSVFLLWRTMSQSVNDRKNLLNWVLASCIFDILCTIPVCEIDYKVYNSLKIYLLSCLHLAPSLPGCCVNSLIRHCFSWATYKLTLSILE